MEELSAGSVELLRKQLQEIAEKEKILEGHIDSLKIQIHDRENKIKADDAAYIEKNEELLEKQRQLVSSPAWEEDWERFFSQVKNPRYDTLIRQALAAITEAEEDLEVQRNRLVDIRSEYLKRHPNRDFSASGEKMRITRPCLMSFPVTVSRILKKRRWSRPGLRLTTSRKTLFIKSAVP